MNLWGHPKVPVLVSKDLRLRLAWLSIYSPLFNSTYIKLLYPKQQDIGVLLSLTCYGKCCTEGRKIHVGSLSKCSSAAACLWWPWPIISRRPSGTIIWLWCRLLLHEQPSPLSMHEQMPAPRAKLKLNLCRSVFPADRGHPKVCRQQGPDCVTALFYPTDNQLLLFAIKVQFFCSKREHLNVILFPASCPHTLHPVSQGFCHSRGTCLSKHPTVISGSLFICQKLLTFTGMFQQENLSEEGRTS